MPDEPLLYADSEWTLERLASAAAAEQVIAEEELGLEFYPYRLEIISSEQMLDAYVSIGLPVYYHHWSFGKHFIAQQHQYQRGKGLAYELVINSDPCLVYLMGENSMTIQALVIAHAAFGHNAFMKNNYLFKQWGQAAYIIDYMVYAKDYINRCEERHGASAVEAVLDACHALQRHGVDRYQHPAPLSLEQEEKRAKERAAHRERTLNELYRSYQRPSETADEEKRFPEEPQENILRFIEEHAPDLPQWKREVIRIVRTIAQYLLPQRQTQLVNEGFATFTHWYVMERLLQKGLIAPGAMEECIHSHTDVIFQPDFKAINPYALGFAMFRDIKRICEEPTDEDKRWFPDLAGSPWQRAVRHAAYNYRSESFVRQFLSPTVMRRFRLFSLLDDVRKEELEVTAIHNEPGYRHLRNILAAQYDEAEQTPVIEVYEVRRRKDRTLCLRHKAAPGRPLHKTDAHQALHYVRQLWEFPVELETISETNFDRSITFRVESGDGQVLAVP